MQRKKFLELYKRSNRLFELTRKEMEKYKNERKELLKFTELEDVDDKEWEKYIEYFEKLTKDC